MTGFVAGASRLIITARKHHLTGYSPGGANQCQKTINWLQNITQWDVTTVAVSVAVIVLMVILKRIKPIEKYAPIIVLVVATAVVNLLEHPDGTGGRHRYHSHSLPAFMLPDFSLVPQLALGSLSVALVALAQGAGISTAVPNPDGSKASPRVTSWAKAWATWPAASSSRWARADRSLAPGSASGQAPTAGWAASSPACGWADRAAVWRSGREGAAGRHRRHAGRDRRRADHGARAQRPPGDTAPARGGRSSHGAHLLSAVFIPLQHHLPGRRLSLPVRRRFRASSTCSKRCASRTAAGRCRMCPRCCPTQATVMVMQGLDFFAEVPTLDDQMPPAGRRTPSSSWSCVTCRPCHSTGSNGSNVMRKTSRRTAAC